MYTMLCKFPSSQAESTFDSWLDDLFFGIDDLTSNKWGGNVEPARPVLPLCSYIRQKFINFLKRFRKSIPVHIPR